MGSNVINLISGLWNKQHCSCVWFGIHVADFVQSKTFQLNWDLQNSSLEVNQIMVENWFIQWWILFIFVDFA
jgi:hypothetical protein